MSEEQLMHLCNYLHARFELKEKIDDGRAAKALKELRQAIRRSEMNREARDNRV